jgi:CRISPR/Cas system CSM-associated protein Csm2 small subunit
MPAPTIDEQLAMLDEAIASAERQVANGATQITYRSVAELIAARNHLLKKKQEEEVSLKMTARRTILYQAGRGYHK